MNYINYLFDTKTLNEGRKIYKLKERMFLEYGAVKIVIPKGFITDLASIPVWISFWQKPGYHQLAAIIHDYAYVNHGIDVIYKGEASHLDLTQKQADTLFHNIIVDQSTSSKDSKARKLLTHLEAGLMFTAVRLFGGRYW